MGGEICSKIEFIPALLDQIFSRFSLIYLHLKWNKTRLLSPESECTNCLTKFKFSLGNFKKIPEMLEFVGEYPAIHPKANFNISATKSRKISCEIFHRKNYFTYFGM